MPLPDDFDAEVHALTAQIPVGGLVTYGQLARLVGMPGYARQVGRALGRAPAGTPCHRVVNHAGRTAPGWPEQRALLEAEGITFGPNGCADLKKFGWEELR